LRHRDFRIRLEGPAGPNDQLFLRDSTFALDATFVKQPDAVLID
jgi:hypothetical protein